MLGKRIRRRLGQARSARSLYDSTGPVETTGDGGVRYLELLKRGLTNSQYLENELRLAHLHERVSKRLPIVDEILEDPARAQIEPLRRLAARRYQGFPTGIDGDVPWWAPFAPGRVGLDVLHAALDEVCTESVAGDYVDVGVGLGGTSMFMRGHQVAHGADRTLWVVDRFLAGGSGATSSDLPRIRDGLRYFDLLSPHINFVQGEPIDALSSARIHEIALLRVGTLPAAEVAAVLELLGDRLVPGAIVLVDTIDDEVAAAAESFRARAGGEIDVVGPLGSRGARWRVGAALTHTEPPEGGSARVHLPAPVEVREIDLSVVVVLYNMDREAQRTLYSLSRQYQLDLAEVDYEVLVVDNGSAPERRLTAEDVRAFGPEFRLIEMDAEATTSPVPALVRGTTESLGRIVAFMIDGAHVLTPGVLSHGLRGMHAYASAVVATQQWYVGPGQQNDSMLEGYDETFEDALFEQIDWPSDGYRLFDIGTFIGDRDWLDGLWESNCLFAPRALVERVGGFDDRFDEAGGGYANLDLYERLAGSPDITLVTILGEGSFHQTHGGTTTNQAEIVERGDKLIRYREKFAELKGRDYRGAAKHMHYIGGLWGPARRSKARRLTSPLFPRVAEELERPIPMPDEAKVDIIATFYNTLGWQDTSWSGRAVRRSPTDLVAYQEIVHRVRPEVIIVTNAGEDGGLPGVLGEICDVVGTGAVIAVGPAHVAPDEHERVTRIEGQAQHPSTAERVAALVGDRSALVIIGREKVHRVARTFHAYERLVPQGSYVVIEDTIVNGNPVLVDHGPGPMEAALAILRNHGDFMVDPHPERFGLTFNPSGYLLRRAAAGGDECG